MDRSFNVYSVVMSVTSCPNCGASFPPDALRCTRCGSYVERPAPQPYSAAGAQPWLYSPPPAPILPVVAVKSKRTAAILAFALGWAGVHRFYLGHITLGLVQFLLSMFFSFCTFGITFVAALVWGVVEGVLIQNGTIDRDADGRPLKE